MDTPKGSPFELVSHRLGALPLVNHFLGRMGLSDLLVRWLPAPDRRFRLDPAVAIRLVVVNLLVGRAPLYGLGEWASPFAPGLLGLADADAAWRNDDRVGRALGKLFHADRASLLTELIVGVVAEFGIDTSELHNDSTSVSVHGAYRGADGTPRGGKPTTAITLGHSKDHRPDLKQLVWILTVCADGAVPMAYRLADGNTSDDPTHIPTWDHLVALLGRADFLDVADSKLASGTAMRHIDAGGGRFVTVLPRTRAEDKWFRDWAQTNQPQWTQAIRIPGIRAGEPDSVDRTFPAPLPSAEGDRIIWVHSSAKAARDATARQGRIEAGAATIDALAAKLASPRAGCAPAQRSTKPPLSRWPTPARPGGSPSPSAKRSRRPTGRSVAADPAPTPATARAPAPGTPSAGSPEPMSSPTTRPPTAAFPSSPTTPPYPTPKCSAPTATRPTSNAATTCSRASRTPTRSGYATPPVSKHSSAASSSPCSSARSSNARSAPPCATPTPHTSRSTRSYAPARHHRPNASRRSSPMSPATNYTATADSSRPSKPTSPRCNTKSSTCSACPRPATPTPTQSGEAGAQNATRKCGTRDRRALNKGQSGASPIVKPQVSVLETGPQTDYSAPS